MKLIVFFLIFSFSIGSLARDAESTRFTESLRLIREGQLNEASRLLKTLVVAFPKKNLYWFNLGTVEALRGNHEYAIRVFGRVIHMQSPLAPAAQLYSAKSLRQLGRDEEALQILRSLQGRNLPTGLQTEIARDLAELTGKELAAQPPAVEATAGSALRKPYWLSLDNSLGYNSNAFADGRSTSGVPSFQLRSNTSGGYHFEKGKPFSYKVGYQLSYDYPTAAAELATLSQTLQSPLLFEMGETRLTAAPYVQWQNWAGQPVSERSGVSIKTSIATEAFDFGADLDLSHLSSTHRSYDYLQGSFFSLRPFIGFFGEGIYVHLSYSYGQDGTQDITYSDSSRLPLQHTYQGPHVRLIWKPNSASAVFMTAASLQKDFHNPSLPSLKKRSDREVSFSLKYSRYLTPGFSIYGLGEVTNNTSTLGSGDVRDKNYEVLVFLTGLSWDVF